MIGIWDIEYKKKAVKDLEVGHMGYGYTYVSWG